MNYHQQQLLLVHYLCEPHQSQVLAPTPRPDRFRPPGDSRAMWVVQNNGQWPVTSERSREPTCNTSGAGNHSRHPRTSRGNEARALVVSNSVEPPRYSRHQKKASLSASQSKSGNLDLEVESRSRNRRAFRRHLLKAENSISTTSLGHENGEPFGDTR